MVAIHNSFTIPAMFMTTFLYIFISIGKAFADERKHGKASKQQLSNSTENISTYLEHPPSSFGELLQLQGNREQGR